MKTFSAALLVAAVCLLATNGAVEASRIGPARQLQQFNGGLGEFISHSVIADAQRIYMRRCARGWWTPFEPRNTDDRRMSDAARAHCFQRCSFPVSRWLRCSA